MALWSIGKGHRLRSDAAANYLAMAQAAREDGIEFKVNSSTRDSAKQKKLYAQYVRDIAAWKKAGQVPEDKPTPVAAPGKSHHEEPWANCVDINRANDPAIDRWLTTNAARFGFYNTVKREPWHWEFTGEFFEET